MAADGVGASPSWLPVVSPSPVSASVAPAHAAQDRDTRSPSRPTSRSFSRVFCLPPETKIAGRGYDLSSVYEYVQTN